MIQIPDECDSCVPWFLEVPEHHSVVSLAVGADELHSISISAEEIRGSLVDLHSLTHTWTDREKTHMDTQDHRVEVMLLLTSILCEHYLVHHGDVSYVATDPTVPVSQSRERDTGMRAWRVMLAHEIWRELL